MTPPVDPAVPLETWLQAGALSSVAALVVFLAVHHVWIKPIWFITPAGLPIAITGGLAIGWSCHLLQRGPVTVPGTGAAVFALIAGILLPAVLLSLTHGPLFDLQTATIPPGQGWSVALRFCAELLVTATAMGALIGWRFGGTPKAALVTALAGLAFALGPGHNVPMFGTDPHALKGFALLLILAVTVALSLPAAVLVLESR